MQYPFSVNEKVVIKVSLMQLFCFYQSVGHDRFQLLDINLKEILNCAGEQANARQICWEGSDHHVPVSKWLVS